MLINFTVEHFRSFGTEQTLNLVATGLKDHPGHCVELPRATKDVLQVGVIYGANASGKSNLVKAMQFAQLMVLGQTSLARLALNRFRFIKRQQPASFEFRFLAGGRVFVYGFSATHEAVVEEWLDATAASGREVNVFTRDAQGIRPGKLRKSFGAEAPALRKALAALKHLGVRDDQLLLKTIQELPDQHRGELLTQAVWWFARCLTVIEAEAEFTPLVDMLGADDAFREFCGAFLKNVGTGIDELSIEKKEIEADKVPKPFLDRLQAPRGVDVTTAIGAPGLTYELDARDPTKVIRRNLAARHQVSNADYSIAFQDESDGTQRCLNLLPALHHLTKECKVFVVDEIDRSLHPLLCHALLKLFLDACPGKRQQMIVTTHETHLLDLDLLRRDEVWFVEKGRDQQSRLTSLGDWGARKDLRIEKGYLQGRFGGIPFIGDTKKLMDLIQCPVTGRPNEKKASARP